MMRSHVTTLSLDRLEPAQVQDMIAWLACDRRPSSAIRQQIVSATDGVPLFVEEVTKMMREVTGRREGVREQAGHENASIVTIPPTLQDLLMARLDQPGGD